MKKPIIILPALIASTFILASCGGVSNPTLGEQIASEGNAVADIGKRWQKGEDMIKKGEKLKKKGHNEIKKGDSMIKKGQSMKQKAEKTYKKQSIR